MGGKNSGGGKGYPHRQTGDLIMGKRKIEFKPGDKYGELTVIKEMPKIGPHRTVKCRCSCGKVKRYYMGNLRSPGNKSCGCIRTRRVDGYMLSKHPLYSVWTHMKQVCSNKNNRDFAKYGGSGICVCSEWEHDFTAFYWWAKNAGWQSGLRIILRDNSEEYSPDNCYFSDNRFKHPKSKSNTSGYTGISWYKSKYKWLSQISVKKARIYLGIYKDIADAVQARNAYIVKHNLSDNYEIQEIKDVDKKRVTVL